MIISRLEGGLGNQMFQYAYGWYAAKIHLTTLKLDLSSYRTRPAHGYLLDKFCIQASEVPEEEVNRVPRRYRNAPSESNETVSQSSIASGINGWFNFFSELKRFKEKPFGFHPRYRSVPNHRYLVGNWQSEKFFPGIREDLLSQFRLKESPNSISREVSRAIGNTRSLALHIRRGDYVTSASAASIYENLSLDYYRRSVSRFAEMGGRPTVFVFSNDHAWCEANLRLPFETRFVTHNTAETAHEDMWLMSQCAGCVIANSTFSWWAAWLNTRPDKQIFAPQTWFRNGIMDDRAINCDDWNLVSSASAENETHAAAA